MALEKPAWREILSKTGGLPSWYRLKIDLRSYHYHKQGRRASAQKSATPCVF